MRNVANNACIRCLSPEDIKKWNSLVDDYADTVLNKIIAQNTGFTPHDFDHHCANLYSIISTILLKENAGKLIISSDELIMLDIGVLLHDISMSVPRFDRNNHANQSVEFLKEKVKYVPSLQQIGSDIFKRICNIIGAHSDAKDPITKEPLSYAIASLPERTLIDKKTKVLAGILRLADELDVSSDRFDRQQYGLFRQSIEMRKSKELTPEETKDLQEDEKSIAHWHKCNLIQRIERDPCDTSQILLVVNEDEVDNDDLDNNINLLIETREKIQASMEALNQQCFNTTDYYGDIAYHYNSIDLYVEREDIKQYLISRKANKAMEARYQDTTQVNKVLFNTSNIRKYKAETNENNITVIDTTTEKDIQSKIISGNHITFGHFQLNTEYCARDWIDISPFFEDPEWLLRIKTLIADHIKQTIKIAERAKSVLLGIDFYGMLLASALSISVDMPFSFMVPIHQESGYTPQDISTALPDTCENVIILCDIIATGNTVQNVINYMSNSKDRNGDKKKAYSTNRVYCVLYRTSINAANIVAPIFTLNATFSIEVNTREECTLRVPCGKCFATNSPKT